MGLRAHRAGHRPVFLRNQDRLDSRPCPRGPPPRPGRRAGRGNRRQLPDLAPDRRAELSSPTRPMPPAPCSWTCKTLRWADDLCELFGVPPGILPEIRPSSGEFGQTSGLDFLPDGLPIMGIAGDQQASLIGQGCVEAGQAKCTYGTGAFLLAHTGGRIVPSQQRTDHHPRRHPGGSAAPVRARGERVRRRRGRAVVPRRPQGHRRLA